MLQLHRASRGDHLAAGLAEVMRRPGADPFRAEIVSVPTRGVERWLTQELATVLGARPGRRDGVCANVEFPFPARVVGGALAAVTGVPAHTDPWSPERSVWPLLAVVDAALDEPWLRPLAVHLGQPDGPEDQRTRRFSTVRHLADLFDRYGVHRPRLLRSWVATGASETAAEHAWQAELWRRLRSRIGVPSPAERLSGACEQIVAHPELVDLPERLSLFGLTRLPPSHLEVLSALAAHRLVHLWLLHPSPVLWERLVSAPAIVGPRRPDPGAPEPAHPLLRTWGRDTREMQLVLGAAGAVTGERLADPDPEPTLLGRIQADIRADREPPLLGSGAGEDRPVLADGDRSLQVHACHGRARQVEVLRDAIMHLLAGDPTLEPRDVIVMCPDIEAFAPLIGATFGPGREVQGADIFVRLADRSLRQTNPVLDAVARLLDVATGRATASDLLDLAGLAPVRIRFGFDDDDLARLDGWVRSSGVRWGIDADWRRPYRLHHLGHGTWEAGLDRLLAGVAVSEDPLVLLSGVLPLDDVDSGDIDLVGRLAEFVSRVTRVLESFTEHRALRDWLAAMDAAADLLLATTGDDAWQRAQLREILTAVATEASGAEAPETVLRPAEVRALLADRLRGVPTRANFRTGHLTMCTLVPMRSVPHRVVCLLGLDDGAFPRRIEPDGDDVLATDPWIGDRDVRSEDRQLLLDAVLAARQTLVITYAGRDERTNAPRPPAVPVGELLDVVDRTVQVNRGRPRDRVVTAHPLQPFDGRNFEAGRLIPERSWSFDRSGLEGARAARRPRTVPAPAVGGSLAPFHPELVPLDDLVRFVEHPARAYLRQRLGVSVRRKRSGPGDAIASELDALEEWQVGDRLLRACLSGVDLDTGIGAELARGTLPPGRLGRRTIDKVRPRIEVLLAEAATPTAEGRLIDVTAAGPGGVVVAGTVDSVFGDELRTVTYSRLAPRHRLAAWVRLLTLSAGAPDRAWRTRTVGRAVRGEGVSVARVGPLGADPAVRAALAERELAVIVDLYLRGMSEPLPLATRTAAAWAAGQGRGDHGEAAARREWESQFDFPKEDDDPEHRFIHDGRLPWAVYAGAPPGPDECGPGWADVPSRAGRLAIRLWGALLRIEEHR